MLGEIRDAVQPIIKLPMIETALHDSQANHNIRLCQQGTRVGILNRITAWINNNTSETIFWLYGPAGTGKSTISRTLANDLSHTGQLGASYFFKRGEKDRSGTAQFFPTIANQLINTIPAFKTHLRKSLETLGNAKVENKSLEKQFNTTILTPLSMLPDESGILTRVIVVDALDECESDDHIAAILGLFSQLKELRTVRLRVFLTCRSIEPIDAFENLKDKTAYPRLALHEDDAAKADISAFLEESFVDIKIKGKITKDPWPDPKDLDRLVSLATNPSPLFIYAATLCRFVDVPKGRKSPVKQLKLWLDQCDSNTPQLNQIYMPILRQVLFGSDKEGEEENLLDTENQLQLQQILGSLVLLATPLPAPRLADLLKIGEDDEVDFADQVIRWLGNLHAVLNVPSDPNAPVRLLHKSFSDFLLGYEGTGTDIFRVDPAKTHANLASKCIRRMENGLSKDICSVRDPGKLRDDIDKATITNHIPPDLEYACLYWVYHLQHSGRCITDSDEFCIFLHTHFLHWLESLSWMGKISEGILAISSLEAQIPVSFLYSILRNTD